MAQITLRLSDELAEELKKEARRQGKSLNAFLVWAGETVVNPALVDDERERFRAKLRKAGLLEETTPLRGRRQPERLLAEARRAAAAGRPVTEFLLDDRGRS